MIILPIQVNKSIITRFKREAKRVFPLEHFAYLLGNEGDKGLELTDLWIPDDIKEHASNCHVLPPKHWAIKTLEYCEEHDLQALGTIHSHPYRYQELSGEKPDHSPSEGDADYGLTNKIHGICRILESKNKRLTATVRFWGPAIRIEAHYV